MVSKHITRDYSAHKKSVIRPYDEFCSLEIFSFDPKFTRTYLPEQNDVIKSKNCIKTSWRSWNCYKVDNTKEDMTFTLNYTASEFGEYRIDFIYEQND